MLEVLWEHRGENGLLHARKQEFFERQYLNCVWKQTGNLSEKAESIPRKDASKHMQADGLFNYSK